MIYKFGDCELDADLHELKVGGETLAVEPQVFDLLLYLVEHRDRMVSKNEIHQAIWKGRIVSEANLSNRIGLARQAVGDDGKAQALIKTFPRRGFRFVGKVEERSTAATDAVSVATGPVANNRYWSDKPSIAVLPFNNLSNDPEQQYFSDGITEDIITALSRIRQFSVIARNTTFTYEGQAVDVQSVARDLGVRYVLEGSVRKAGNRVRISAQLIDGETGNHLWAEKYDRELADIFDVQDEITRTVVGALQPELTRSEIERARSKPPESLDAWDLYLRGLWHQYRANKEDNAKAIELFSRAIELDSEFARLYAGLSHCYNNDAFYRYTGRDPKDTFAPARKAVEIDPQDASAHRALGWAFLFHRDHSSAKAELERAIELNPSEAHSHAILGFIRSYAGFSEQALECFQTAMKLSPHDPHFGWFQAGMALALLFLQRHEESVEWARKALQYPNTPWLIRSHFVSALAHSGRIDESKKFLATVLEFEPDCSISFFEQRLPIANDADHDHYFEGLRKAGMPE